MSLFACRYVQVDTMSILQTKATPQSRPITTPALHQYACLRCRARRVRCDKILTGCAHCAGHAVQCVYSARRPRKPNKAFQHQVGQRSLLPAASSHSSVTSGDTVSGSATEMSGADVRDSEPSGSDEEDTIIMKELRDGLHEASKDEEGAVVIGGLEDNELFRRNRVKQVSQKMCLQARDAECLCQCQN